MPGTAPVWGPCDVAYAAEVLWRRAYIGRTIVTSAGGGVNGLNRIAVVGVGVRDVGRRGAWLLAGCHARTLFREER